MSNSILQQTVDNIINEFQKISQNIILNLDEENHLSKEELSKNIVYEKIKHLNQNDQNRVLNEFYGWGPVYQLIDDIEVTEILINSEKDIFFEKNGSISQLQDCFFSLYTYEKFVDFIGHLTGKSASIDYPFIEGHAKNFRVSIVTNVITTSGTCISLRRHPQNSWTLEKLIDSNWCTVEEASVLKKIVQNQDNVLISGGTGSGKTSVLNSLLQGYAKNHRVVVIEDASEVCLPNSVSLKMLTREDPQKILQNIDATDLLKKTLRLRPDSIVMGEIRGDEAKDFLMALATGHHGCLGTIHASDPRQALLRLEMLIQMACPQWSLAAIRRLIYLSLQTLVITGRLSSGARRLQGIYKIAGLEDHGLLFEKLI